MVYRFYRHQRRRLFRFLARLEAAGAVAMSVGCLMALFYGAVAVTAEGDLAPVQTCRPGVALMSNILPDQPC